MKPGDRAAFAYAGYLMAEITMLGKVTATIVDDNDEFRPSI